MGDGVVDRLTGWLRQRLPAASDLRIEGADEITFGHSAEMLILTLAWRADGADHRRSVVLRLRPPVPGLLEPYD
nr:hypothetical protein [Micromonospora sp. DSM 115978]